ncbi:TPA: transposase [Vibrio parahaemolyticus]|uniref:DNA-binding protein n=1 Tax=Vibrio antiquarius (strain Ex25) TaxID=150340 RepID=UPI0026594BB5|nr:DNA-binding protein [Vibrio antiquarius]MCR9628905.1 Mu transposase C-terminal domain-containing protein [Vibrio antiquarius]MCR9632938.1 Mu transposase C-terminal domain-containing protein [Vibrio antiquarius]HCH5256293.1 transposase [Vibrio parahaemolyticus]
MNKEWFTPAELAGMPGLPSTDRNIRTKAQKEGWKSQKKAKGKGYEYHISSLPIETRTHVQKLTVAKLAKHDSATQVGISDAAKLNASEKRKSDSLQKVRLNSLTKLNSMPESKQNKVNARLRLLDLQAIFLQPFKEAQNLVVGEHEFVDGYNSGSLEVEAWVRREINNVSFSTLRRWRSQVEKEGAARLAGNYESNQKPGLVEQQPEMQNYLIALVTGKPHLAQKHCVLHRLLKEKAEKFPHWKVPSASSVGRWRDKWVANNVAKFTNLTDPDSYNNKHRPLYAKMYPWIQAPNDCWEFDSTPTDVQLNVDGKLVRYSIIAAIDVFTRRVKLLLAPTSSSEGICLLLRKCILDWGVLNEGGVARTDNGSDYVSKRVTSIMQMLNLDQSRANPFSGWEKPYIERFFGTMSRALFELLPGYIGHSVSDRQKIEAARAFAQRIGDGKKKAQQEALELALTPTELEEIMNDWLEHSYNHTAHDGLKGDTPFNCYSTSGYRPRKIEDSHSLDLLLNYVGEATVIRGGVKANSLRYTAPELMNPAWDRKKVRVFNDPSDVGIATLYPLDQNGVYIEAISDELVGKGVSPDGFRAARKRATKDMAAFRKASKKLQEEYGIDTQYAETLAARKAGNNLATFGLKGETVENEMLGALAKADKANKKGSGRSEHELERLEMAKKRLEEQEQQVKEQKGLAVRNIHEKAKLLANESLERELTEKELAFLMKYKRENAFSRKAIEEIMAQRRQA